MKQKMLKNKKSQLLKALVRTILAVIVLFVLIMPACNRLRENFFSYDYLGSYEKMLENVDKMSNAGNGDAIEQILELDSGTAVLVFPKGIDNVKVHQIRGSPGTTVTFFRPDKCESASSCVCMCKEIERKGGGSYKEDFSCTSDTYCQSFNFPVTGICKIDGPYNYKWECTQGVVIDRGLKEDRDSYLFLGSTAGADQNNIVDKRRIIIVTIEKRNDMVAVCENPDPVTGCKP